MDEGHRALYPFDPCDLRRNVLELGVESSASMNATTSNLPKTAESSTPSTLFVFSRILWGCVSPVFTRTRPCLNSSHLQPYKALAGGYAVHPQESRHRLRKRPQVGHHVDPPYPRPPRLTGLVLMRRQAFTPIHLFEVDEGIREVHASVPCSARGLACRLVPAPPPSQPPGTPTGSRRCLLVEEMKKVFYPTCSGVAGRPSCMQFCFVPPLMAPSTPS